MKAKTSIKKRRTFNLKSYCIALLRRGFLRSPLRTQALGIARKERGIYECQLCKKITDRASIQVDHVEPVIPVTGWISLDSFAERLFCAVEGLQAICTNCHDEKTKREKECRMKNRKEKK